MTISDFLSIADQTLPNESIKQRISDFLDATIVTTLDDAEAEIASWDYTDVTSDPERNPTAAFRVYVDPSQDRYVCANEQQVIDLANGDEDYECVTPDCSAHVDESGDLCGSCTAWLETL